MAGSTPYLVTVGEHPGGDTDNFGATLLFNLDTEAYSIGANRPNVGDHHAAEVVDNKLYLFGGLDGGTDDVQIGTLVADGDDIDVQWREGADMPFASGSAATALINGKVYYCGGVNGDNTGTTPACAVYDVATDTWSTDVPPMPEGRNHAATCTDGTKMYVFGGREGRNTLGLSYADTQIFTPGEGWSTGAPMPVARGGMGKAVFRNGQCYVFGGEVESGMAASEEARITTARVSYGVDIYDIASDTWSRGTDMPVALHGIFPVLHDNAVFLNGGGVKAANSQSMVSLVFKVAE